MRPVVKRSGPLAVALFGVACTTLMIQISDRRLSARPEDDMLRYGALEASAWLILGISGAIALGWLALRARRPSRKTIAAFVYVVTWVVLGSALAIDIAYDAFGPGVEPVRDTCNLSARDCMGQPSPSAPILGSHGGTFVAYYAILSTPLVLLASIASAFRSGGAGHGAQSSRSAEGLGVPAPQAPVSPNDPFPHAKQR